MGELPIADPAQEARVKEALGEAEELRRKGRYQEGIDLLVDVLEFGIMKADIYYRLGNIYYDSGDLDRAEYSYRRAIDCNPEHINAHHNLAVICKHKGKLDEAVRLRRKTFSLEFRHPRNPGEELNEDVKKWARGIAIKGSLFFAGLGVGVYLLLLLLRRLLG